MTFINLFGLVFVVLIMIPTIIYAVKCKDGFVNVWHNKVVECFEQVGRFACMGFMIFLIPGINFGFSSNESFALYLIINTILIVVYCLIWIICFSQEYDVQGTDIIYYTFGDFSFQWNSEPVCATYYCSTYFCTLSHSDKL